MLPRSAFAFTDRCAKKIKYSALYNKGMKASDFIPGDRREWRRFRALCLSQQGWYQREIAMALGVSTETVCRWLTRAWDGGPEALRAHPGPGSPPKLSPAQKDL